MPTKIVVAVFLYFVLTLATIAQPIHGPVRPEAFGAVVDDNVEDTHAIQAAINTVATAGGGSVVLAAGSYLVDHLVLKAKVKLIGQGDETTWLKALPGSASPYVVTIDRGPVHYLILEHLGFIGGGNRGQGALLFEATPTPKPPYHGGLWYSSLRHLTIRDFEGNGIYFKGGIKDSKLPNQFIEIERVYCRRSDHPESRALLMTGMNGHINFVNCQFDGNQQGFGTNVELKRDTIGNMPLSDISPNTVSFVSCTFQDAKFGILIDRGRNIHIKQSWFENLERAITVVNTTENFSLSNCNFANAASDGKGGGYGVGIFNSSAVVRENFFQGLIDTAVTGHHHRGILLISNTTTSSSLKTSGITAQVPATKRLQTYYHRTLLVSAGPEIISELETRLGVGETITLLPWGGKITLEANDHLNLGGREKLVLPDRASATFMRFDRGSYYVLISVSAPSIP